MSCFVKVKLLCWLYGLLLTDTVPNTTPFDVAPRVAERKSQNQMYELHKSNYTFGHYKRAAVASSSPLCAQQGTDVMRKKGGNAVDAAIVTLLCDGVVSLAGLGIGGGFFMTIWNATEKKAHFLNAREYAPAASSERMFTGDNSEEATFGAKAIAIPGEVAGYWEAHQRFGKLKWSELFEEVISLCENGFKVTEFIANNIQKAEANLTNPRFASLRNIVKGNKKPENLADVGDVIRRPKLAETFRKIRDHGKAFFYEGEIAKNLSREIQAAGGIITLDDFKNYKVEWKEPVSTTIKDKILYSAPTPGSGAVLVFMLNVLEDMIPAPNEKVMWQRLAETFKWGYARRNELGDFIDRSEYKNKTSPSECLIPKEKASDYEKKGYEFVKENDSILDKDCLISVAFRQLLRKEYAKQVRTLIDDAKTWNDYKHYNMTEEGRVDRGTAHTSVLGQDGSAVSITSSINNLFGSMFVSESTGIILNNQMDDYSYPDITNGFGLKPSEFNFIRNKSSHLRPMSSMTPTIILNKDQTVRLIIGCAGGTKITTSVAQGIVHNIFLNKSIRDTLDYPRIHHNLWPMALQTEDRFQSELEPIYNYLNKTVNHTMEKWLIMDSTLAAIAVNGHNDIDASGDYRRQGGTDGF